MTFPIWAFWTTAGLVPMLMCGRRAARFVRRLFTDDPYESTAAWIVDGGALLIAGGGLAMSLTIATAASGLLPGLPVTPRLDWVAAGGIAGVVPLAWSAVQRRRQRATPLMGLVLDSALVTWTVMTVTWVAGVSPWA